MQTTAPILGRVCTSVYLLRQLLGKMKGADWHPRQPQLKQRHSWVPALGANPERA